ncbi:DUF4011 domain-containing protein [Isoptericola sp. b515]|uniref:DUF4011 domain-containing protein n=1 Tax=Isoptericola sp. b515 TaxID=3064652 RepID=UPI00271223DE|nr:DUF4011 domain-containing protein [Isoptericola sp. b515]MDO8147497.1 DUF4011 domain-containing protein [Isoptericola sp. b515]
MTEVLNVEPIESDAEGHGVSAQLRATVSDQWSWAAANARIPQVNDLEVTVSAPLEHARVEVTVTDGEVRYGGVVVHEGPIGFAGLRVDSIHVPLSASAMARVEERRGADCLITLRTHDGGPVLARFEQSVDLQPRDLWLRQGEPRREQQLTAIRQRHDELTDLLRQDPESPDAAAITAERRALFDQYWSSTGRNGVLSCSLLASYVRPNHPEVATLAREAADVLEATTGDASFYAFQLEGDRATRRVEETVDAVYTALHRRQISYSEPPPGWDYRIEGQRIRDHGDVARRGLGTCMDTTVLMAAVLEHVGLLPVLVLVHGHIFVGYWRRDPRRGSTQEWYPDQPVFHDPATIRMLIEGGFLGLIETTAFASGDGTSPAGARKEARSVRLPQGFSEGPVEVVDIAAARLLGVAPLPAVHEKADGSVEVVVYGANGAPEASEIAVAEPTNPSGVRRVDQHPPRFRTWKSSLFSLDARNALLNLRNGPSVQPVLVDGDLLGTLENDLNRDVELTLLHGDDLPEVVRARDVRDAADLKTEEQSAFLKNRKLFVQRTSTAKTSPGPVRRSKFVTEVRSMARRAKEAHDERGMNPLFLCLGLLRWEHKNAWLDAPLILVPVRIIERRTRGQFALALDTSAQTTPNVALLEWLRSEHGLTIPELAEPANDAAGVDVSGILAAVRATVADRGLPFAVESQARLALLDLSAFRMWQDLTKHGDEFLERPLVKHLVHTPAEPFVDPVVGSEPDDPDALEALETPIPADATQRKAVVWAREGRTFVLQGPPGTGKSQTITNMVAECVLAGQKVLFVAEKGTALAVVQRRVEAIGLAPFMLNLHHEGSSAAIVRAQLKRSLSARVADDPVALEAARRRLQSSRFELGRYPERLHRTNAAGWSAYGAHDQLLVLGDGPSMPVRAELVAHRRDLVEQLREVLRDVQPVVAAADVRPDHPWRFVGRTPQREWEVGEVGDALRAVLDGTRWADGLGGPLRAALDDVDHPHQLQLLVRATDERLPRGATLRTILERGWVDDAAHVVTSCERMVTEWSGYLRGFRPEVLEIDLLGVQAALEAANASGIFGRSKRQAAALEPLTPFVVGAAVPEPASAARVLGDLIKVQEAERWAARALDGTAGLSAGRHINVFLDGVVGAVRRRYDELLAKTESLRAFMPWAATVRELAAGDHLAAHADELSRWADAWSSAWDLLGGADDDLAVWLDGDGLVAATRRYADEWRRQIEHERLLPLQRWSELVAALGPLREAGLAEARTDLLAGRLAAEEALEAFERGLASTSQDERVRTEGLDRFDAAAHDRRVRSYAEAEAEVRTQWVTGGPARLLARRGGGGAGKGTGGLARELEKTTRRLGTRAILRKYAGSVQELTPLVLASPSSAVDLIEPGKMEFDLVIFDEASQITVPEAVGAIGRAKAVVVVGDSKQMPPSRKVGAQPSTDEEVEDTDAEEPVEDQESILSECELARVPTLKLSWHYRSQDEALIAFSNAAYYEGDLSSFPAPSLLSSSTGVELVRVDGRFIRAGSTEKRDLGGDVVAGKGTNADEALAIVAAVRELLDAPTPPTVGVVTFNEQQRQLIEDLLTVCDDPRVAAAMDESAMGPSDVLFVKALEQVQGDERDVVLFSVAFSKQANGKIPLNFGPLSNLGGERRLNVAVTRARRKNVVFCSFEPEELDAESASYRGVKDLKQFLLFARAAGRADESGTSLGRTPVRDRHRDDVARALRDAGLHVRTDVGLSDFRLDLVLSRPEQPDRVLLPVLLDGESWKGRRTVSDRDVLPVEVLSNLMGWPSVARVWWPMWLQNRDEVITRILAEVEAAETALADEQPPEPVDEPDAEGAAFEDALAGDDAVPTAAAATVPHASGSAFVPAFDLWGAPGPSASPEAVVSRAATEGAFPADVVDRAVPSRPEDAPEVSAPVFVPAHTEVVGERRTLDELPSRAAAVVVRTMLLDVVEAEGPVAMERLVRIVGRRFGLTAVRASRAADIARLVPRALVRKSRLGTFVWPEGVDPDSWTGYRQAGDEPARKIDEIAPEEIAAAMRAVLRDQPGISKEATLRRTAAIFGPTRLSATTRARLEAVWEMVDDGS